MARISEDEVRLLVETVEDPTSSDYIVMAPFIEVATLLVDRIEACAAERGYPLTSEELKRIEQLLAAHFYALRDRQMKSKRTERAAAAYDGETAMGLDFTPWGQMAKVMDTSGCLDSFGKYRATASWLGKPPSEQTDYVDRD